MKKIMQSSSAVMRVHKNFINKHIKPTIGTPDFLSVIGAIETAIIYNDQYYGDVLIKIHKEYAGNFWLPFIIFKIGYMQALVDTEQRIQFENVKIIK